MNTNQLIHLWANQSRPFARSGNVHFDGRKLFSYQTCIAQIFTAHRERLAVFSSESFTTTTARHLHLARCAWAGPSLTLTLGGWSSSGVHCVTNAKLRTVPTPARPGEQTWERLWVAEFKDHAENLAIEAERARRWAGATLQRLREHLAGGALFPRFFRAPNPCPETTWVDRLASLSAHAEAEAAKHVTREGKRRAEMREAMSTRIARWQDGELIHLPHMPEIYLRTIDDRGVPTVETSWGARVPLEAALRLFKLCQAVRDGRVRSIGYGMQVGDFHLRSIAPDGSATVGCHKLAFAEMARLAATLGVREEVTA